MANYGNIFLQTLTNAIQQSGYQQSINNIMNIQGMRGNNPRLSSEYASNVSSQWGAVEGVNAKLSLRRTITCGETECGSDDIVS